MKDSITIVSSSKEDLWRSHGANVKTTNIKEKDKKFNGGFWVPNTPHEKITSPSGNMNWTGCSAKDKVLFGGVAYFSLPWSEHKRHTRNILLRDILEIFVDMVDCILKICKHCRI